MGRDYKKIRAWQLSDELAFSVYKVTKHFPKGEIWGLISQMRRASISVPANIAEGSARNHTKEYLQFLYTAIGSLTELGYYIYFSGRIGYLDNTELGDLSKLHEQTAKTLRALINYIEKSKV
ncbi:MAG: four helix bundle protein [Candidatus Omnitrophica bacterium]|nr:four helix bundle protein [Candidatus Omnitrophota bacterium]